MPDVARDPESRVQPVYLDYATTTLVDPRVARHMLPYMTQIFGNPASRSHAFGWAADEAVELTREQVASLVNADPREIVWTSGATESDNLALKGAAGRACDSTRRSFVRSSGPNTDVRFIRHDQEHVMAYSDKVLDHYENPRNVGSFGKDDDAVGTGMVGAPACGDVMRLQIRVNSRGVIEDARFKTYGCGSAIASSSLVTEWVKGKTLDEAMAIRNTQIAEALALPPVKIHCSILAEDAIKAAVADFRSRRRASEPGTDTGELTTDQPACASSAN